MENCFFILLSLIPPFLLYLLTNIGFIESTTSIKIYRIPTSEGLLSNMIQFNNICYTYSSVDKGQQETFFLIAPYHSIHFEDISNLNICEYFRNMECKNGMKTYLFDCTPMSVIEIINITGSCFVWNDILKDRYVTIREESFWWDGIYPVSQVPLISIRDASGLLISGKSDICFVGAAHWHNVEHQYLSYDINPKYSLMFKEIFGNSNQYGIVHWRRGDQLTSRCLLNHEFEGLVFDFSINCVGVRKFIKTMNYIQSHYQYPIFVATNEKNSQILSAIESAGYKVLGEMLQSVTKSVAKFQLNSADLLLLEWSAMIEADTFWGAGQSSLHSFLNYHRSKKGFSKTSSIPGITNEIVSHEMSLIKFIYNMFLNLDVNRNSASNAVDAVALHIDHQDVNNGRIEAFFKNMSTVSSLGLIPPLYVISNTPTSDSEREYIMKVLTSNDLITQFSDIIFKDLLEPDSAYIIEDIVNSINFQFYSAMEFLSEENVTTVLYLEPDVLFTQDNWFDKFHELSELESFWILGSYYKGKAKLKKQWESHLSGVALYNVGSSSFMDFLKVLQSYNLLHLDLNYCLCWKTFLYELNVFFGDDNEKLNIKLRYIFNKLLNTNSIANFSDQVDETTLVSDILIQFPSILLLLKKQNSNLNYLKVGNIEVMFAFNITGHKLNVNLTTETHEGEYVIQSSDIYFHPVEDVIALADFYCEHILFRFFQNKNEEICIAMKNLLKSKLIPSQVIEKNVIMGYTDRTTNIVNEINFMFQWNYVYESLEDAIDMFCKNFRETVKNIYNAKEDLSSYCPRQGLAQYCKEEYSSLIFDYTNGRGIKNLLLMGVWDKDGDNIGKTKTLRYPVVKNDTILVSELCEYLKNKLNEKENKLIKLDEDLLNLAIYDPNRNKYNNDCSDILF